MLCFRGMLVSRYDVSQLCMVIQNGKRLGGYKRCIVPVVCGYLAEAYKDTETNNCFSGVTFDRSCKRQCGWHTTEYLTVRPSAKLPLLY